MHIYFSNISLRNPNFLKWPFDIWQPTEAEQEEATAQEKAKQTLSEYLLFDKWINVLFPCMRFVHGFLILIQI